MILGCFLAMDMKKQSVQNAFEVKYNTEIASSLGEIPIPLLA